MMKFHPCICHKVQVSMCEQQRFKSVCAFTQSIRVLVFRRWPLRNVGPLATHRAPIEDSGQTTLMRRLI